jgi:uncharacterized Zn finger protein (UPF0148 family)
MNAGNICPVCGKHTFEQSGNYEICPICEWENDPLQAKHPDYDGGANELCLNQFRAEYDAKQEKIE